MTHVKQTWNFHCRASNIICKGTPCQTNTIDYNMKVKCKKLERARYLLKPDLDVQIGPRTVQNKNFDLQDSPSCHDNGSFAKIDWVYYPGRLDLSTLDRTFTPPGAASHRATKLELFAFNSNIY